jgi:hypothetical protein
MRCLFIFVLCAYNLFAQNAFLPLTQPFNIPPWNYAGTEQVTSIPPNVVDWVLVELRGLYAYQLDAQEVLYRRAGFLKTDGTIVSVKNDTIRFGTTFGDSRWQDINAQNTSGDFYLVIYQRNHIPVMSKNPVRFMDGYLSVNFDFSKASNVWKDTLGVVKIYDTTYAMIAGDADGNGIINVLDYTPISQNLFTTGYKRADIDNNGIVNVLDYTFVKSNLFRVNLLPKIYKRQQIIPNTITASSYIGSYTPQKLVDGITSDNPTDLGRWKSSNTMPQWVQFQFTNETYIENISINFYSDASNSSGVPYCKVETSNDGVNWNLVTWPDYFRFKWNQFPLRYSFKYLKFTILSVNAPLLYISIWEIDFYTYSPN